MYTIPFHPICGHFVRDETGFHLSPFLKTLTNMRYIFQKINKSDSHLAQIFTKAKIAKINKNNSHLAQIFTKSKNCPNFSKTIKCAFKLIVWAKNYNHQARSHK